MQFSKGPYTRHFIALAVLLQNTTSAPRKPRLSIADWGQAYHEQGHEGHGTYAFGYNVDDPETGNTQFRDEERHSNGSVTGSYGLLEPDGNVRVVHYIADENGFRVRIVNSEKPSVQFPAPTAPLVAASEGEGQGPGELPEGPPEQPELVTELLDENYELPPRPSQRPPAESPDEENLFGVGDSAVVAAIPEPTPTPPAPSNPPNTIVIPGGFVIEIPPDDPEDDGGFPSAYTRVPNNEVSPTAINNGPPPGMVHPTPSLMQFGPVLFHPQTTQQSVYSQYNQPPPTNYYLAPTYNPYYSFLQPTGYYEIY